jgi:hypothetical protein
MSTPWNDAPPLPTSPGPFAEPGPSPARTLVCALVVLLGGAGLGALGGWLWWRWWSPAPEGEVFALSDGGTIWVPQPAESGYSALFDATAQYAVLGAAFGALLGVLAALLCRRRELVGLAAAVVGSALGAVVMLRIGTAQSPPDPESRLADAAVGDVLPGALEVAGWTPYLGWPGGALAAFVIVLLLVRERTDP